MYKRQGLESSVPGTKKIFIIANPKEAIKDVYKRQVPHYKTKKLSKCWHFEFDKNIFDDVKVIKNKLYKKRSGKLD